MEFGTFSWCGCGLPVEPVVRLGAVSVRDLLVYQFLQRLQDTWHAKLRVSFDSWLDQRFHLSTTLWLMDGCLACALCCRLLYATWLMMGLEKKCDSVDGSLMMFPFSMS